MITQFRMENFKGHRDTKLALHPFTVLVGDNGSGKTSVLEALRLSGWLAYATSTDLSELLRDGASELKVSFAGPAGGDPWSLIVTITPPTPNDWTMRLEAVSPAGKFDMTDTVGWPGWGAYQSRVSMLTGNVALYRFRSEEVAAPAYAAPLFGGVPSASVAENGALTAAALAALKLADDEVFDRIETSMRQVVPSLRRVFIKPATLRDPSNPNPVTGSKLYFDFQGAKGVPAHHASQGTLIALALLTVLHSRERPSVILLDDFDHSLHPRAQIELVRMIKELLALDEFRDTQIIATTHSPYVLDEVSPSEVIAFALRDDGTVAAKPLSEHPDAPKVNGSLKAGELWTLDAERDWVR